MTPNLTESQYKDLTDAADVLETEASQLSIYIEHVLKTSTDRHGQVQSFGGTAPHRVSIAIASEMRRLRSIAASLRGMVPKPTPDDEE